MYTVSASDTDLFAALRAGAAGYLLKDADPSTLAGVLAGVLAGEAAMPATLVSRVIDHFRDRAPRRRVLATSAALTSREWEVLDLMARGEDNARIARTLGISAVTVRTHVGNILRKLRVPDRESAVRLFTAADSDR
jgi:DNA-binding NarL/FixJ family response regulator